MTSFMVALDNSKCNSTAYQYSLWIFWNSTHDTLIKGIENPAAQESWSTSSYRLMIRESNLTQFYHLKIWAVKQILKSVDTRIPPCKPNLLSVSLLEYIEVKSLLFFSRLIVILSAAVHWEWPDDYRHSVPENSIMNSTIIIEYSLSFAGIGCHFSCKNEHLVLRGMTRICRITKSPSH